MTGRKNGFPAGYLTCGSKDKFEIQDPFGIREVVQPIVSISKTEDKITGLGTCFQISPWSWLTAQHVVSDSADRFFPKDEVGAVGFSPGLVFGRVGFSAPEHFAPVTAVFTAIKERTGDQASVPENPDSMHVDLATLKLDKSRLKRRSLTSPLPISRERPKPGDEVIAMGFPILGSTIPPGEATMLFSEQLFGAGGIVSEVHLKGRGVSRPWPTLQIEGDWESGMSGGPVVNMSGEIVGIVSSSFAPTSEGPGIGFAVSLADVPVKLFAPELELHNPGWARGWGVFNNGKLVGFFETEDLATQFAAKVDGCEVKRAVCNPKTEDWMEI